MPLGVVDVDSGKLTKLVLGESDLRDAADPFDGSDWDRDVLLPPKVTFLQQQVCYITGRITDHEPGNPSDLSLTVPIAFGSSD